MLCSTGSKSRHVYLWLIVYSIIHHDPSFFFFFLNDPAPPEISSLPLHAALPILPQVDDLLRFGEEAMPADVEHEAVVFDRAADAADVHRVLLDHDDGRIFLGQAVGRGEARGSRSEEHTSELQSRSDLVCRLLLEK